MKQKHRILIAVDGPDNNILKMKPPMTFGEEEGEGETHDRFF